MSDHDEPDVIEGWLCLCGHWEETDLHCSSCGNEPPWGCDCDVCNEDRDSEGEDWEYDPIEEDRP